MVDIRSELQQYFSNERANNANANANYEAMLSDIKAQASKRLGTLVNGSVIGINANKVNDMTATIVKAVSDIDKHLETVHTETDPSQAFADPEMQNACKAYIRGVMEVCSAYTSQLLKLATELDQIKAYYVSSQAKQASTLSNAGTQVASSVEKYTYAGVGSN